MTRDDGARRRPHIGLSKTALRAISERRMTANSNASFHPGKVRCIAGLSCLLAFCCAAPAASAQYRLDSWTADTGLPQNIIHGIRQTPDGYLWVATFDGLARFDGVRFTTFDKSNSPGMSSNRIRVLYKDLRGDLWMGTESGEVTRYQNGTFTTYNEQNGLPGADVGGITGDDSGNLWVLAGHHILQWDNGRFVPADLQGLQTTFAESQWDSGIFFAVVNGRLYRFTGGQLISWELPAQLLGRTKGSFAEYPEGTIWIATNDKRIVRMKEGRVLSNDPAGPGRGDYKGIPISPDFGFVYRNQRGDSWDLGLRGNLLRSIKFSSSGNPESLSFSTLFEDQEGNIWLGSEGRGLYRLRKQSITVYSEAAGLVGQNAYPVFEDHSGDIWIGGWDKGISRFHEGHFTSFTGKEGMASGFTTAIAEDRQGRVWVASHNDLNGGLRVFDGRRFIEVHPPIVPNYAVVRAIEQDREGAMWFGSTAGLVRYKDGVLTAYATKDGLPNKNVSVLMEDSGGALWVGTFGGLACFKGGAITSWTEADGLPSNNVRSLYEDSAGVLWIGTYDGGLGRFEDGRFTRYTTRDGLFNNGVFQILEDGAGTLWMSSNRGIYSVSKEELNEFAAGRRKAVTSVAYGRSDGMLDVECNGGCSPAGVEARDGRLWFPTQNGVAVIDPKKIPHNPAPPPVMIESFLLDRSPVSFGNEVRIQPGQEDFEIDYTALSFINSEQLQFKYRLEGLDSDWVDAGVRRAAYYSRVPPGTYTFKVIAANSDGVWNSEGKSLRIVVLPPFYRTWWFIAIVGGSIIAVGWAGYRHRVGMLRKQNAVQQTFARRLIESQESERKRIASELHDSLGQLLLVIKNWATFELSSFGSSHPAREGLTEISSAASQAIDEVREIIYDLRPYQLDKIGLAETIRYMIEKVAAASNVAFHTEIGDVDGLLSHDSEIILYRIVQECVSNVIKHSQATMARVTMERAGQSVILTIEDDGRGFVPEAVVSGSRCGMGLTGISERARMLGGKQTIHSTPGIGTRVIVSIDIEGAR